MIGNGELIDNAPDFVDKKTNIGAVSVDEDGAAKLSYNSDSDILLNFRRLEVREESGASSRIIFANFSTLVIIKSTFSFNFYHFTYIIYSRVPIQSYLIVHTSTQTRLS